MKKILFLGMFVPVVVLGQTDTLSLSQCVQIALSHNPQIRLAEGGLDLSYSNLKLSRSALLPQISASAGITRNGGTFLLGNIVRNGEYDNYATGVQAQQLVFDFGKTTSKLSASGSLVDASMQDLKSTKEDVILNTYIAYYNYLAAERVRVVDLETVAQAMEHLNQAQAFYKAGTVPQYDVVDAEVSVANDSVNLITAENGLKIARVQLENAVGMPLPNNFELSDILEVTYVKIGIQEALDTAMANRPELLASEAQVEAGRSLLTSAWTSNLPNVLATGAYNWRGLTVNPLYSGWNIGVTVSLPIFQGFALDAGIDQAKANLKSAQASNDLVMQSMILDVEQQEYALQEAGQKILAARKLVQQAEEALRLAVARYNSGTGSAIETTDAEVTLANARITYIQSLYDYSVSYARLQRAMGVIK